MKYDCSDMVEPRELAAQGLIKLIPQKARAFS